MDPAHKGSRRIYQDALPLDLCRELLFIQRSLAVVGYRPHVQSLTLYELVLACPQLLPTVAKARQIIWDLVEAQFDAPFAVWPETTSLISWTAGASIGWHHDANRSAFDARCMCTGQQHWWLCGSSNMHAPCELCQAYPRAPEPLQPHNAGLS